MNWEKCEELRFDRICRIGNPFNMLKRFVAYWWGNAKEAFDMKENTVLLVGVVLYGASWVCKIVDWNDPLGETVTKVAELSAIVLACVWGFMWMPFKRLEEMEATHKAEKEKLEKVADKPVIAIETLLLPVQVLEGLPVGFFPPKTKKKDMFHVKVRNQSPFPVNIDAIGLTINDRLLRCLFWIPSNDAKHFPRRLEARSSVVMQFGHVETTSPNDVDEIDGVYVETGCGHSFTKKDSLFHEWSKTADLKPMDASPI